MKAPIRHFLADRTIGRAFGTVSRLSVVCLSVCDVLYCGETVRPSYVVLMGTLKVNGHMPTLYWWAKFKNQLVMGY